MAFPLRRVANGVIWDASQFIEGEVGPGDEFAHAHTSVTDEITASATHFSSANKLVCAISVRVSNGGSASGVRMFYTYEQFASGKKTATLSVR